MRAECRSARSTAWLRETLFGSKPAAEVVLARQVGAVVTNLSTSRMLDAVCARRNAPLHRTPVGEAYVVAAMRARGAVVGGEGNGGVILPAAHYGRDGLVAVALICQAMSGGQSLRALADRLGREVVGPLGSVTVSSNGSRI